MNKLVFCKHCGIPFLPKTYNQKYCSKECKRKELAPPPRAVHEERTCPQCGKIFVTKNARSTYCSRECQYRARTNCLPEAEAKEKRQNESFEKTKALLGTYGFEYVSGFDGCLSKIKIVCLTCGAETEIIADSIRERHKTTCPNCKRLEKEKTRQQAELQKARKDLIKALNKVLKQKEKELEEKIPLSETKCKYCGKMFVPKNRGNKVCPTCKNSRKDRRFGKHHSHITWQKIWERDNHTCWLCGKECNPNDYEIKIGKDGKPVTVVGGTFPSVDHIVPVFNGGQDTFDNVRLAHQSCNTKRGVSDWHNHLRRA